MDVLAHTALEYRRRICRAMNYISAHLDAELSLDDIARHAAFSPFHFHRIFKAVTGETVAEFTRRLRLETAANQLLTHRRQPITAIAHACGFSSSQNMAKAFRLHFGQTPTAYRNSKMGNIASNPENALTVLIDHHSADNQPMRSDMKAEIQTLPDYDVAFVRKLGPYGKEVCDAAFGELMAWAGPKGLLGHQTMLGVYWDNPEVTPPAKCRTDACLTVPADFPRQGPMSFQRIPGGPHAVCHFDIAPDGFAKAWEDAFAWFVAGGYECADRPCFERYGAGPEQNNGLWSVDICIPLKQK